MFTVHRAATPQPKKPETIQAYETLRKACIQEGPGSIN